MLNAFFLVMHRSFGEIIATNTAKPGRQAIDDLNNAAQ
jgi:hypothetical protein